MKASGCCRDLPGRDTAVCSPGTEIVRDDCNIIKLTGYLVLTLRNSEPGQLGVMLWRPAAQRENGDALEGGEGGEAVAGE